MSGKKAGTGEKGSRSRRARRGLLLAGLLAGWLIWLWAGAASADMNRLIPYYSWGSGGGTEVGAKELGVSRDAKLPVYGAPFEEAWRGAGGRAAVSAAEPFLLLGSAQDGEWLLVSYQVDAKAGRIGWIRRPKNMPGTADSLSLERALCEIGEDCVLTDDPLGSGREIRRMTAGEQAIALLRIQREDRSWTCVETEAEGRTVWGFVPSEDLYDANPCSLEGETLVIREGVTRMGAVWESEDWNASEWLEGTDPAEGNPAEEVMFPTRYEKGEIWVDTLYVWDDYGQAAKSIRFPSTLRTLDAYAIDGAQLKELRIPGTLEYLSPNFLYRCTAEKIILSADYRLKAIPKGDDSGITAWEAEEGNPLFRTRDGVLFGADGKTLYAYPNRKPDLHYDVPKGTETIYDYAFSDSDMDIRLQTISLPAGLKKIGRYAFSGCGRLNAVTVPLTVTEMDPTAFVDCVSLERLSLPPWLRADFSESYSSRADYSSYTGDNGATGRAPDPEGPQSGGGGFYAWIRGENGEGEVPGYADAESDRTVRLYPSGTLVWTGHFSSGRAKISWEDPEAWVETGSLMPRCEGALFRVTRMSPTAEGEKALREQGLEGYTYAWMDLDEMQVHFILPRTVKGERTEQEGILPLPLTALSCDQTDPARSFAYLYAERGTEPIRLLDRPEGTALDFTYRGEEAEILERSEGWLRVRTVRCEGWIREENAVPVTPEGSGN